MPLEIELKYLDVDLEAVSETLRELGATFEGKRFESNTVFDDDARSLKQRGILVRLRDDGRNILTLKKPPQTPVPQGVKVWDERETELDDPDAIRAVLDVLGCREAFQYEKVREEWVYGGCHVCLDHMPFGDFVELEGAVEDIEACAAALGIAENKTSTDNYHQLNKAYRRANNLPENDSFVFSASDRKRLIRENHRD